MHADRFLVYSGIVSFVIFLIIAIPLGFLYPGYNQLEDVISKQGAVDSPIMLPTNVLLFLMGMFLFFFGIGIYRNYAKRLPGKTGSVLIILAGLSAMLVGVFPCDAGCINTTVTGHIHQFVPEMIIILATVGIIFFVIEETVGGGFKSRRKNHWNYIFAGFLLAGVIFCYIYIESDSIPGMDGIFQRIAIGIPLTLTALVSVKLKTFK